MSTELSYGFKKILTMSVEDAEARVREALGAEGFGILTEIDIQSTFKEKLDVDFRPYRILGACSPPVAWQALNEEDDIGLLLPCNVVVYAGAEAGTSVVAILDPVQQLAVSGRDDLGPVADEVQARLKRVLEAL
ncbi:MAG: DUF302 domain-containing protein [Gemmatimonadota bacterium]|nr:DUF302 domain-containing protein [Gemmatimonadota bacterium]MDE3004754.1 DUF302 domain-containing protein [Gemmatimonadota bacterium]MDE3014975.1 DUF302 domain-containing protein [Gemmatimonadota bacterium]